ncbi:MAG: hypothetical protein SGI86_19610 [Deltaproteobacteria bacterium]|nr:hypothetical protein [Deltaproteobacteria bacterium]
MVLKYLRAIMCLASTFSVSSSALLAGCGDGVFTTVQGESSARDDAAFDAATAIDAPMLDDAGMPFATNDVTPLNGGCVSLPRVTVCIPSGAVVQRATMSLRAFQNENIEAASDTTAPGMYVLRVEIEPKLLRMGTEYFPCVAFDYNGFDTSDVVGAQYFDRQGSRGWEPLLSHACSPMTDKVVGAIAEANERLTSGIIITAAQSCNTGSDCKTNYCSAKVCQ